MSLPAMEPREGSSLYYSLLWTDPARRRRLLGRLALLRALATTLEEVREPAVAERKIHWWHEEIDRLIDARARHPAAIACEDTLGGRELARAPLLDVLSVGASARFEIASDEAEEDARHLRGYGARLALLVHALGGHEGDLVDDAPRHRALALGLGRHEALARLPARLHRGYAVFARDRYARHALTPETLAGRVRRREHEEGGDRPERPDAPDHRPLLSESVDEASAALEAALGDPTYRSVYARPELAPLARLAALRAHELRLWRRTRPDLLHERVSPTPLVKLLIAWRHRHGPRRTRRA